MNGSDASFMAHAIQFSSTLVNVDLCSTFIDDRW